MNLFSYFYPESDLTQAEHILKARDRKCMWATDYTVMFKCVNKILKGKTPQVVKKSLEQAWDAGKMDIVIEILYSDATPTAIAKSDAINNSVVAQAVSLVLNTPVYQDEHLARKFVHYMLTMENGRYQTEDYIGKLAAATGVVGDMELATLFTEMPSLVVTAPLAYHILFRKAALQNHAPVLQAIAPELMIISKDNDGWEEAQQSEVAVLVSAWDVMHFCTDLRTSRAINAAQVIYAMPKEVSGYFLQAGSCSQSFEGFMKSIGKDVCSSLHQMSLLEWLTFDANFEHRLMVCPSMEAELAYCSHHGLSSGSDLVSFSQAVQGALEACAAAKADWIA